MALLGHITSVGTGQSAPQTEKAFSASGIPFVRAGSLQELLNGGSESSLEKIQPEVAKRFGLKLFPENTIVFAKSGMSAKLGRVYKLKQPCYVVSHLATVEPTDAVSPDYLFRWFGQNPPSRLINNDAYPSIKTSVIASIDVPLPPLKEQKRIAAILDMADAIRRKRQEAIQLADRFLRSVFLELFGDPITNPKGWRIEKFGELGILDRGRSKHRPRNDPALLGGEHPLIQTGDVANSNGYIEKYRSTYSDFGLQQSRKWPKGTLCITIAANIANTGVLAFDACFPDSVVGYAPNEKVTGEYIQGWLDFLQKTLEANAPKAAQKNINLAILRELDVPVPDKDLQDRYTEIVLKLRDHIRRQNLTKSTADDLFDSISRKAFAGELHKMGEQ